jgi:hypothetical protein
MTEIDGAGKIPTLWYRRTRQRKLSAFSVFPATGFITVAASQFSSINSLSGTPVLVKTSTDLFIKTS